MKNLRNLAMMSAACLVLTGTIPALPAAAATVYLQPPISGTCGDLEWAYDTTSETLTILGEGEMEKDAAGYYPWVNYKRIVEAVVLEEGVSAVTDSAFRDFVSLERVFFPASVTEISDTAFAGCTNLKMVIGYDNTAAQVFAEANGLEFISGGDVPQQPDIGNSSGSQLGASYMPADRLLTIGGTGAIEPNRNGGYLWNGFEDSTTEIIILEGVTEIGAGAFAYFVNLEEVTIPASVTSISASAFANCGRLTVIHGYEGTAAQTFAAENGITFSTFGKVPSEMETSSACGENLIWEFDMESGTLIFDGSGDMYDWKYNGGAPWSPFAAQIQTVVIADGITQIGERAFQNCTALTSVTLPASVTQIGEDAFLFCHALNEITVLNPNAVIVRSNMVQLWDTSVVIRGYEGSTAQVYASENGYAFEPLDAPETSGTCGENLTWEFDAESGTLHISGEGEMAGWKYFRPAPWNVFADQIRTIVVDSGVTSIGESAFEDLSAVTSVQLPESITSIGFAAFNCCSALTEIVIPEGVTAIKNMAFYRCGNLKDITIPETLTDFRNDAFEETQWLENRRAESPLVIVNDILLDGKTYAEAHLTLPAEIVGIADGAFENNKAIQRVTIPYGIGCISASAFAGCSSLTEITIPGSVTEIGTYAFYNCYALEKITLPRQLDVITSTTFLHCKSLTEVTVLNPDTAIYDTAFDSCENLTLLRGYVGSTAQTYAAENGYAFEPIPQPDGDIQTGDADGDGNITANDAQLVLAAYLDTLTGQPLPLQAPYADAADVDRNGTVDSADAQYILRYYLAHTVSNNPVSWEYLIGAPAPDILAPDCAEEPVSAGDSETETAAC